MRDFAPLLIEPCPSRILLVSGAGAHTLASVSVAISSLPLWIKAGWIVAIVLALMRFGWQYGYRRGRGFIARIERLDGVWRLETGDRTLHRAGLTGGYAHPGIVILNFRLENSRWRSLVLLPDATDADALRRLRVWLRTRGDEGEPDPP